MQYRNQNFTEYLKLHSSVLKSNFFSFGWLFVISTPLIGYEIFTETQSLFFSLFFPLCFSFWSVFVLNGTLFLSYKNYKSSSKSFLKIEPFIKYKKLNAEIETRYDKVGLKEMLLNYNGEQQISLGNFVDIFETEHSVFVFSYSNAIIGKMKGKKIGPKIIEVDYSKPIRFTLVSTEKISFNLQNTFKKFSIKQIDKDAVIEFKDKKFRKNIKLRLKNYTIKMNLDKT